MQNYIKLPQPPLVDFGILKPCDDVYIIIKNTTHQFSSNSAPSGTDCRYQPIFGTDVYINNILFTSSDFGLPFMRFPQGSKPKITYENKTLFTFNIHYHGLNTMGLVDGASMESIFGVSTLLGPKVTFQLPKITNNQSLIWYHNHNMFVSMELIYAGAVGLIQVTDKKTSWLNEEFIYGDNQILLAALDMDFTETGTQTSSNLVIDENRSCFTVINGISALNWYSPHKVPFTNSLYHDTTKNLIKVDILNASLNWRVFHIGVCDEQNQIHTFYLVQTDTGLMNPTELTMTFIPVASRISIIIDLNKFKNGIAHLFFYNYELTEIFGSVSTFPDEPNNTSLTATIPDLKDNINSVPYPTPIPDPNQINQQQNFSNLGYPTVNLISQTEQKLQNGTIKVPKNFTIKPFLKIIYRKKHFNHMDLSSVLNRIKKTIFGTKNLIKYENILDSNFEYEKKFNYLSFLNPNYYYNIPRFDTNVPKRNFLLFPEVNTNAIAGGNQFGTTEFVNGANRIMTDLWNSNELDLNWAIQQYQMNPNNYKPSILPTSKFRIYKTNDTYSNTAMISNDTLTIEFYQNEIMYGDFCTKPLAKTTIIFPETKIDLNIQEWINLANQTFSQNFVTINNVSVNIGTLLSVDWSFFPYTFDYMYQKSLVLKSAVIKTLNNSPYYIRFLGRWPILQLFGKPMTGSTLNTDNDLMNQLRLKQYARMDRQAKIVQKPNMTIPTKIEDRLNPIISKTQYIKCDEYGIFGIYDADVQAIFPFYATTDGDIQLPIACMKRNGELIICPNDTYIGLYDGYLNDNINSFSVKLHSSELWLYNNGDCADSHPFHFHLTSGYAVPQDPCNSPGLLSKKRSNIIHLHMLEIFFNLDHKKQLDFM